MSFVVAIDFESFGIVNTFTQLGAVIFDTLNDKIVSRFSQYASDGATEIDERCYREFWSVHPDLFLKNKEMCLSSQYTSKEVIKNFWNFLHENVPDKSNVYFIGDNVAFDYSLLQHFSDVSILYGLTGSYMEIVDVSIYYIAYGHYTLETAKKFSNASSDSSIKKVLGIDEIPKFNIVHTHDASDDAASIAYKWSYFTKMISIQ
jgi:hypothetical protein